MFEPVRWDDSGTAETPHADSSRTFFCTSAPLTCPGHGQVPAAWCVPPPVRLTEVDVISRQVPSFGLAYADLADAVLAGKVGAGQEVNETLLLDVLAFLDRNPDRWTQHRYLSPITDALLVGCVAGWAVVLGGVDPADPEFPFIARDGIELHRKGRELLGFSEYQAGAIFGFIHVVDGGVVRHPTFHELCGRVFEVTGIRYKPLGAAA